MADLSDNKFAYLKDKNIPQLMEYILQKLVTDLPENPMHYIGELMEEPVPPRIIVAGPPGSGKGTQCEAIAEKFGVVHISTGDLIREEATADTEEGRELAQLMEEGDLVPDEFISQLVYRRLQKDDAKRFGWLLDGFPRSKQQAMELDTWMCPPHLFILLDVADEEVFKRIEHRRADPVTGNVYHLIFNPPPKSDKELWNRLVQRTDDHRDTVAKRLEVYREEISWLMGHYGGITEVVDGNQGIRAVTADVLKTVESRLLR
ncbi:adenylate kinase, putative [Trypanosoma equiperdum]|uniref:Adenylate kinase, putative n=3 Tax=Trypanozoon TaxID=39700 RepID=Q38CF7_TRYB2|nr:adenylate kinase, putative [Trypanosoma brucei gambiense DAL972]XP_822341.1 adenylate kinase, putative [Trypanosoma brucei brucei TREU927]EAN77513.1 adenylate kinase, putative [Trypanosoma brucei brucei TREU927]CBH15007.1 adenylate kinase, putative [Trypanosoma brucei gambiense DAL972]SCU73117.1 adenylate kinase, putative [Trypanosoma equiperdum]|eukprot:XP_011777273.1 adenylate kinase, putative [Trypanosoma brucei gambiense DAL972]